MKSFDFVIKHEQGMHIRPAGLLAKQVKNYESLVCIEKNGKKTDVTRLMSVMTLGIKCGESIRVCIEGVDEEFVEKEIYKFFEENL